MPLVTVITVFLNQHTSPALRALRTRASVRYDHEFLTARHAPLDVGQTNGVQQTRAAAFILDLTSDRRDNPLVPHKGFKLNATLEYASDYFGGT